MVVFAIAGMQQGKSRAQHIPVRKPFAAGRCAKVRRGNACDACEVLSKPFSAGSPFGGCGRYCFQFYTNKTLSASLQQDEAKAESESNEGDRMTV